MDYYHITPMVTTTNYWEPFSQTSDSEFPPVCRSGDTQTPIILFEKLAMYVLSGLLSTFHNEEQNENFSPKLQSGDCDMHVKQNIQMSYSPSCYCKSDLHFRFCEQTVRRFIALQKILMYVAQVESLMREHKIYKDKW